MDTSVESICMYSPTPTNPLHVCTRARGQAENRGSANSVRLCV